MLAKEIRLYGELGKKYGRVHHFHVANVAEAIRALQANFHDFEKTFLSVSKYYRIWTGKDRVPDAEQLINPIGTADVIRIAPAISGAKGGLFQAILGIAIIGAAVLIAGPAGLGATAFSVGGLSVTFGNIAMFGVSLALGGISQMLTPVPKAGAQAAANETKQSYLFNGAVNVSAQGSAVPVGYGRMIVGSVVISAGIGTEDIGL